MASLALTIKYYEEIQIGDTVLFVEKYKGGQVRLHFEGPKDVKIQRLNKQSTKLTSIRFKQDEQKDDR